MARRAAQHPDWKIQAAANSYNRAVDERNEAEDLLKRFPDEEHEVAYATAYANWENAYQKLVRIRGY